MGLKLKTPHLAGLVLSGSRRGTIIECGSNIRQWWYPEANSVQAEFRAPPGPKPLLLMAVIMVLSLLLDSLQHAHLAGVEGQRP